MESAPLDLRLPAALAEAVAGRVAATAEAARVLGINPFDQPNVQEAKDQTAAVLEGHQDQGELHTPDAAGEEGLRRLLAGPARAATGRS